MNNQFYKDPTATLDFKWDWSNWLADGESISSVVPPVLTVPTGLTLESHTVDGNSVTAWLSGGEDAHTYVVTCEITTDAGRVDSRLILISCATR